MNMTLDEDQVRRVKKHSSNAWDWLLRLSGVLPMDGSRPLTEKALQKTYTDNASFAEFLPFRDYDNEEGVFHFYDGVSVGAVFEIKPIDVEGRPLEILKKVSRAIDKSIRSVPPHQNSPWIIQSFLEDEPITGLIELMGEYAVEDAKARPFHKAWLKEMEEHIEHISKPDGLFHDSNSNIAWRGLSRKIRIVIYRRSKKEEWLTKTGKPIPGRGRPATELRGVVSGFTGQLINMGCTIKKYNGEALFKWLLPWFNPAPTGFKNVGEYLKARQFPVSNECFDAGADLAEMLLTSPPQSRADGTWVFQGRPSRLISLQAIDTPPATGLLTAEQETPNGKEASLWDKMPPNSVWVTTIVVLPQSRVKRHCDSIISAGGQGSSEAIAATAQAKDAKTQIASGRGLYPAFNGIYIRGRDDEELATATNKAVNALIGANFNPIDPRYDVTATDNFLRFLPMSYSYEHDKKGANMTRLTPRLSITGAHHPIA